jgi:hypothetical protein
MSEPMLAVTRLDQKARSQPYALGQAAQDTKFCTRRV